MGIVIHKMFFCQASEMVLIKKSSINKNTGVSDLAARGVTVTADELKEYIVKSVKNAVSNPSTMAK